MTTEYTYHEVADLFPMMDKESFAGLCKDIETNGLLEPIWLYEGQIVDGRNRYCACKETGREPKFREWDGKGSLVGFVASLNLNRRHMDSSQKAAVSQQMLPMLEAEARERQRAGGGNHGNQYTGETVAVTEKILEPAKRGKTAVEIAAEIVGVNPRYVQNMKIIAKEAPEKVQEIRDGKVTIPQVMRELRPKSEKPKKDEPKTTEEFTQGTQAMHFATIAQSQLERIRLDDPKRVQALLQVQDWIANSLKEEPVDGESVSTKQ